jgi:hypothetical protein
VARFCFAAQALQIGTHVRSVLVTGLAIFLERLLDNFIELRRHVRVDGTGGGRLAF